MHVVMFTAVVPINLGHLSSIFLRWQVVMMKFALMYVLAYTPHIIANSGRRKNTCGFKTSSFRPALRQKKIIVQEDNNLKTAGRGWSRAK